MKYAMNLKILPIALAAFGAALASTIASCEKPSGCTEVNALNYDYEAQVNDGSCQFSEATFYASKNYYYDTWSGNYIPVSSIAVAVDGNALGTITGVWPNGPGNCSATGTLNYAFSAAGNVDWNTTVTLTTGATLLSSGSVSPKHSEECIKVRVY